MPALYLSVVSVIYTEGEDVLSAGVKLTFSHPEE